MLCPRGGRQGIGEVRDISVMCSGIKLRLHAGQSVPSEVFMPRRLRIGTGRPGLWDYFHRARLLHRFIDVPATHLPLLAGTLTAVMGAPM